jgi:hypothetical protein
LISWIGVVLVSVLLLATAARAEGVPSAATLVPKTTVGFISTTNYDNLDKHWNETQLGKLMADPAMEPFEKDIRDQIRTRWSEVSNRLGIHLEDLEGLPAGEASLALITPSRGEAAAAMLIDVTGRLKMAEGVLAKAREGLLKEGAKENLVTIEGATVYLFDVPLPKEEQSAAAREGQPAAQSRPVMRQTAYFLTKNLLGASDSLEVIRGIVGRLVKGAQADSLAELPAYQAVMKRCAADAAAVPPQICWFVYPLGYAEAVRAATPAEKRHKGKTVIEIMRKQGFGAVQGVGGYFDLATDGYQFIYRICVYAPKPYVKSMKMLSLPNKPVADFLPQPWVPGDIATYTTLYLDILNAFDNFGYMYDEIVGEEGIWAQTLKSMKEDPDGPQIDLREELAVKLGQRVTMISDYKLPITTQSERLLFAIEVKDAAAVAKAVEKSLKNDPTAKKRVIGGRVIWEIVEEQEAKVPSLSVELPALAPKKDTPKADDDGDEGEETKSHLLPHAAITVAEGHLLISSHIDFLLKILEPLDPAKQLRNNKGFLDVWKMAESRFGMKEQCGREFSWTDEEIRPTYELIRQGKMPESETLLGRALNSLSGAAKKGTVRQQRIKGGNLPDYEIVRRALGPVTVSAASEPAGWFFKGVLLPKPAAATSAPAEKPAAAAEKPAAPAAAKAVIKIRDEPAGKQ